MSWKSTWRWRLVSVPPPMRPSEGNPACWIEQISRQGQKLEVEVSSPGASFHLLGRVLRNLDRNLEAEVFLARSMERLPVADPERIESRIRSKFAGDGFR